MQKIRRIAVGIVAVLTLAMAIHTSTVQAKTQSPKVIVAVFRADWCPVCKRMAPSVKKTMMSYKGDKDVKFVVLDLTNAKTKAASAKLAAQNGITPIWKANRKTGMVLLIDAKTRKVIGSIVDGDTVSVMKNKIEAAKAGPSMKMSGH